MKIANEVSSDHVNRVRVYVIQKNNKLLKQLLQKEYFDRIEFFNFENFNEKEFLKLKNKLIHFVKTQIKQNIKDLNKYYYYTDNDIFFTSEGKIVVRLFLTDAYMYDFKIVNKNYKWKN